MLSAPLAVSTDISAAFHERHLVLRREESKPGELVQTELVAADGGNG